MRSSTRGRLAALAAAGAVLALAGSLVHAPAAAATPEPPDTATDHDADLPPLDPQLLREAVSGLPNDDMTGALVEVTGRAGHWSGTAGVRRLGTHRTPRPDGQYRIGSVTKAFTAVIALQLADEGKLRLGASVQRYLPGVLPRRYPRITVRQLLDHTSGLPPSQEDVRDSDPRWYVRHRFEGKTPRQVIATATDDPMVSKPGTEQRYNGVNYFLAGLVIEKAAGHSYAHELRTRILRPLDLHDTYLPVHDNPMFRGPHAHGYVRIGKRFADVTEQSPYAWAEGGMISSSPDLTRFLRALFRGELLPRGETRKVFTVPDVPYTGDDGNCQIGPDAGRACYSVGLTRTALPNGVVLWGKSGATQGYTTAAFGTRDLRRVMVYNLNPTGNHDGSEAPYVRKIVASVFDPSVLDG